jgi:hypothetical protein
VDISEYRDELIVLEGPKEHYLVTSIERMRYRSFWGTEGAVYQLPGRSADEEGEPGHYTQIWASFNDSSLTSGESIKLEWTEEAWSLHCGDSELPLTPLSKESADRFLEKTEFQKKYWRRIPLMLARDEYGTYYFVDEDLYDKRPENIHVYSGWMGNMLMSKMHLVARDSVGSIFSTRSGDRRLIMDQEMYSYVEDEVPRSLRMVPVSDNYSFIHGDLGVYTGKKRGTPCDLL